MKIVAGMGKIEDYIRLVEAGADEVFCGYVPYEWNAKYGSLFPLNRREVLYYNTQIGTLEDMKILSQMVKVYKVPVTITLNYLYYLEEQYPLIRSLMQQLIELGFDTFIMADLALVQAVRAEKMPCQIQLSGECAELNRCAMSFLDQFKFSRYIFHRKNTIEEMASCVQHETIKTLEYEAFILNERCHYTGGFCHSLHCDELVHLCKMAYEMGKVSMASNHFPKVDERFWRYEEEGEIEKDFEGVGASGCGLCALPELKKAGITHLKVVGRGNYIEWMEKDVRTLKKALEWLEFVTESEYKAYLKEQLFQGNCSEKCYYYETSW